MTEFIKLPCGDWINPAQIQVASLSGSTQISVWFSGGPTQRSPREYYGEDAAALAAALDELSMDPDITAPAAALDAMSIKEGS